MLSSTMTAREAPDVALSLAPLPIPQQVQVICAESQQEASRAER